MVTFNLKDKKNLNTDHIWNTAESMRMRTSPEQRQHGHVLYEQSHVWPSNLMFMFHNDTSQKERYYKHSQPQDAIILQQQQKRGKLLLELHTRDFS